MHRLARIGGDPHVTLRARGRRSRARCSWRPSSPRVRAPDYDPLRHPVSALRAGPAGLAAAAPTSRSRARCCSRGRSGSVGAGSAASARRPSACWARARSAPTRSSATRPASPRRRRRRRARLHDLFGVPVFLGIPAAAFVEARRGRGAWRLASAASGAGMLGLLRPGGRGLLGATRARRALPAALARHRARVGHGAHAPPTLSRILGAGPNCVSATPSSTKPTER